MSSVLAPSQGKEKRREGSSLVHWVRSMIAFLPLPLSKEEIVAKKDSVLSQRTKRERKTYG